MCEKGKEHEVVTKVGGPVEGERHAHPSYGSLVFHRVTGGDPNLFGSSIKHRDKITLEIRTCEYDRGLGKNWYHPKDTIVEVEMSYTQFAEAITTMNMYEGVPCTIRYIDGKRMPPVPFYNPVEVHRQEFKEQTEKAYSQAQELIDKVADKFNSGGNLNKKDRQEIMSLLHQLSMNIGVNQEFQLTSFNKQMEHTVAESKGEVEAFMQYKMQQLAQLAMQEHPELVPPIEMPEFAEKPRLKLKKKEDTENA